MAEKIRVEDLIVDIEYMVIDDKVFIRVGRIYLNPNLLVPKMQNLNLLPELPIVEPCNN